MQNYQGVVAPRPMEATGAMSAPSPNMPFEQTMMRNITIQALNHGYVVAVGCHSFAIEKASDLIAKLAEYINNPAETEKKWNEGKLF